jgi:uncharacterized membrane protein
MSTELRRSRGRTLPPRILAGVLTILVIGCAATLLVATVSATLHRLPREARWGMVSVTAVSHAAIYLGLTLLFGRSLAKGRTPLVTLMAEQVQGPLTPRIRRYTRRVTVVWTLFGLGQVVGSGLLLALAPLRLWSLFVNGLDLPLVLLLFVGEYAYRRWRYPANDVASLADSIRVTRARVLK